MGILPGKQRMDDVIVMSSTALLGKNMVFHMSVLSSCITQLTYVLTLC